MGTIKRIIAGGPLSWRRLATEGIVIVLFLLVWFVLAGLLIGTGIGFVVNEQFVYGAVVIFLGLVFFFASNYIVLIRILGQSVSRGLRDFNNKDGFTL